MKKILTCLFFLLATSTRADNRSCHTSLTISYPNPHRVRISFGSSVITGGTEALIGAVRFSLQCNGGGNRLTACQPGRNRISYGGDSTITTTCQVAWASRHPVSSRPNIVTLIPNPPLEIPQVNTEFCSLEFDMNPIQPGLTTQTAEIGIEKADSFCDNGLRAGAVAVGGIVP